MMNEKENKERCCVQYYTNDIDKLTTREAEDFKTCYDYVDYGIKEILYYYIAEWMKDHTLQNENINKQVKEKLKKYGDDIHCSDPDDEEKATDIIEMVLTDKKGKTVLFEEYKAILTDDSSLCAELLQWEKDDANEMLDADKWFDKHSLLIKVSPKENLEYRSLDFSSVEDIETAFSDYSDHTTSIEKEKNKESKETYGMTILWYRDGEKIVHREYRNTEAPELHKASEKLLMLLPAPTNSKDACWRRLCHLINQKYKKEK